jgi:hypothetical protein
MHLKDPSPKFSDDMEIRIKKEISMIWRRKKQQQCNEVPYNVTIADFPFQPLIKDWISVTFYKSL